MLSKEQAIINAVDVDELSEARDMITNNLFERVSSRIEELKETIKILEDDQDDDEDYQAFFKKALKKFGVSSPDEFDSDDEKKKFFDYVDKEWKSDKEED